MTTARLYTCLLFVTVILCSRVAHGELSSLYYALSCPLASFIVKHAVIQALENEKRMGASLLRLHFHDCFVQGCDGSVLLDDTSTFTGEKNAGPNANSLRGFDVIDTIKTQLEIVCPGVVSCADILAIAARDSVVLLGGPTWTVPLGRKDSTTASLSGANNNLPSPFSNLATLISAFKSQGLSEQDMIALSGGHSIGQARCQSFRSHVYNDTNIDSSFANSLKANCPSSSGDNNLSPLDLTTPDFFDNTYYKNLKVQKGLLHSDQALVGGSSDALVNTYSTNPFAFFDDFAIAMVNMGNISPPPGSKGEIRKKCRAIN